MNQQTNLSLFYDVYQSMRPIDWVGRLLTSTEIESSCHHVVDIEDDLIGEDWIAVQLPEPIIHPACFPPIFRPRISCIESVLDMSGSEIDAFLDPLHDPSPHATGTRQIHSMLDSIIVDEIDDDFRDAFSPKSAPRNRFREPFKTNKAHPRDMILTSIPVPPNRLLCKETKRLLGEWVLAGRKMKKFQEIDAPQFLLRTQSRLLGDHYAMFYAAMVERFRGLES